MALGKYSRVDGRKSSSSCSTVTFVVFIGLCLVGVWLMTSSSIVPVQNVDDTTQETKNEVLTQIKESNLNDESNQVSEDEESQSESKTSSDMSSDIESSMSVEKASNDGTLNSESLSQSSTGSEGNKSNQIQPKQFEDNPGTLPEDATKGDNLTISTDEGNFSQPEKTVERAQKPDQQSGDEQNNLENRPKSETESDDGAKKDSVSNMGDQEFKSKMDENKSVNEKQYSYGQGESDDDSKATTLKSNQVENKSENSVASENTDISKTEVTIENKSEGMASEKEVLSSAAQSELLNETMTEDEAWKTQAAESKKEAEKSSEPAPTTDSGWKLCNVTAGPDFIPCLDNLQAIRRLRSTRHFEHKERHCPDEPPTCLVPLPEKYQCSIQWPESREKV